MDADPEDAADPAAETTALLRAVADLRLSVAQLADLDTILDELDQFVRAPEEHTAVLFGANGDLKIIELTATEDGTQPSRAQRERIKRLMGQLSPHGRRQLLLRRRR